MIKNKCVQHNECSLKLLSTNKLPNNSKTRLVHITMHTFIVASTTIMAKGKKVAKAPKSKSQPKAPMKQKALPAPHKATCKRPAEELLSDDESEDETPQKPQKRSKVIEHVDSHNGMDSDDPEHKSDNDEAHGSQHVPNYIWLLNDINIFKESDGMDKRHHITIPAEVNTQKEKVKDLRLIFSDKVKVQFTAKDGTISTLVGWWCNPCKYIINSSICKEVNSLSIRANPEFTNAEWKWKVFHTGRNSSCQSHICQHYELYKDLCKQGNIPEQHWAIPCSIWNEWKSHRGKRSWAQSREH